MGNQKVKGWLVWMGVLFLQLVGTQLVTFVFSMIVPGFGSAQYERPWLFAIVVGLAFGTGAFLAGWLVIWRGWLRLKKRYPARLAGTLVGAWAPLFLAVVLYGVIEPGNPFFGLAILLCILGFYLPGLRIE